MKKTQLLILVFLAIVVGTELHAAISLELFKYDNYTGITIDVSRYPLFKAKLRVKKDGSYVTLLKENLLIVEDCWSSKPRELSSPDGNSWQEVSWVTRIKGPYQRAEFMVVYNNECAIKTGIDNLTSMAQIRITNSKDKDEPDMFFGDIPLGKDTTRGIIVNAPMSVLVGGQEQTVRVDSVKTYSKYFTWVWKGSSIDTQPPPLDVISPFYYRVKINFKPDERKYYRDKFSVYYEGGKVEEINLIGNNYEMKRSTILNVVEPNGGEIVQPCQIYKIKWKGHVKNIPTTVFYSIDKGATWIKLGSTLDSTFDWKVPNLPSDMALIKVKQEFKNTNEYSLTASGIPIRKVTYRSDGYSALSANDEGKIFQWDLNNFTLQTSYTIDPPGSGVSLFPYGLDFLKGDSVFVAAYSSYNMYNKKRYDTLAWFNVGSEYSFNKIAIEQGYFPKKMFMDSKREKLVLIPEFGNRLIVLAASDGTILQNVTFPYPISGFAFNSQRDEAAVVLYSGEIDLLKTTDFSTIKTFDYNDLPVIMEVGLSGNGELFSLGCQPPTPNVLVGNTTEIHVAEISSGTIFRTIRNTSSNPVGLEFNPTSNVLVVGSVAQPQIALWDLPSNEFIGTMSGNENILTDFRFSPEGHSILTASTSSDNLVIRFFTYPEQDSSDNTFRIVAPNISIQKYNIEPKYLATTNEIEAKTQFCNKGIVPLIIDDAWFYHGTHFKIIGSLKGDTLLPNDCLTISMIYNPLDTGKITDSIAVSTCIGLFYLPVESYSLKRNISFLEKMFDFGDLCVGDTVVREIELARNDDPVPLKVNDVTFDDMNKNPFFIIKNVNNEIIPPGGIIKITVRFAPKDLGIILRSFIINHSDQTKMIEKAPVSGNGIGSFLDISHNDLRFVPEIADRKIRVKNLTPNDIIINKFVFSTDGIFTVTNPLPLKIPKNQEVELDVHWYGIQTTDLKLQFEAEPCMIMNVITVGMFSGNSTVSIPSVQADPKGEATILINYSNKTPKLYSGSRFFEAEFGINPRIFLPQTVNSKFGTAQLTKDVIENDKRIIGFRVEGDFPESGTIAEVKGIAGLAETDVSPIELIPGSVFWGKSVLVDISNGTFQLINLCGDRRILQGSPVQILNISPNPASNEFNITYKLDFEGSTMLEVYNEIGNLIIKETNISSISGLNILKATTDNFMTGTYKIVIRQNTHSDIKTILIIK